MPGVELGTRKFGQSQSETFCPRAPFSQLNAYGPIRGSRCPLLRAIVAASAVGVPNLGCDPSLWLPPAGARWFAVRYVVVVRRRCRGSGEPEEGPGRKTGPIPYVPPRRPQRGYFTLWSIRAKRVNAEVHVCARSRDTRSASFPGARMRGTLRSKGVPWLPRDSGCRHAPRRRPPGSAAPPFGRSRAHRGQQFH